MIPKICLAKTYAWIFDQWNEKIIIVRVRGFNFDEFIKEKNQLI